MIGLLRKLISTCLIVVCIASLSQAQADAIVIGKIDSATSRTVRVEFKRNHFSLEEGSFETILDSNNMFSFRVKANESRAVFLTYRDQAIKIFIASGDTLKMRFHSARLLESLVFDGNAASHNEYLLQNSRQFPDWLNETPLENARTTKTPPQYLAFVDSIFTAKKRFFDSYPSENKANFSNEFFDFALNDVNYWRATELMLYVKKYGLKNDDPQRQIDDSYFYFLFETDNVYFKALNNEYYLQYLDLYLAYLKERDGRGRSDMDIIEEKIRVIQLVKPKTRTLRVIEEPYLTKETVSYLSLKEEAVYQNLLTTERFKYLGDDSIYTDIFLKIRTNDGKSGWIPQSAVNMYDKTIVQRTVRSRFCFDPSSDLCGFDMHLNGKVLYFTMAKDLLFSFVYDMPEVMESRMNNFISRNPTFREYNNLLREAYRMTLEARAKNQRALCIPTSCEVTNYDHDLSYYAIELRKLRRPNQPLPDDSDDKTPVINVVQTSPKDADAKQTPQYSEPKKLENPPKDIAKLEKPSKTDDKTANAKQSSVDSSTIKTVAVAPNKAELTLPKTTQIVENKKYDVDSTIQKIVAIDSVKTKPSVSENTQIVANKKSSVDSTSMATAAKPMKVEPTKTEPPKPVDARIAENTKPKEDLNNKVKSDGQRILKIIEPSNIPPTMDLFDAPQYVAPPTAAVKPESSKTPLPDRPRYIAPADGSIEQLDTTQEIVPWRDMPDYDSTGKPLIFKGLEINDEMPPFKLMDFNNRQISQSDLSGKVVFIEFWATYCGPCVTQWPHLQRMAEKYKDNKDVVFLFIDMDSEAETWRYFLKENPTAGLHGNDNVLIPINFLISGLPNHFVIGKNGKVALNSRYKSKITSERMIDYLLKK